MSYADVLEAIPSVVSVYTTEIVSAASNRQMPEFFRHFNSIPQNYKQMVRAKSGASSWSCSGVIVSSDGYIITNHHVVTGRDGEVADEIKIRLSDDQEYPASLIILTQRRMSLSSRWRLKILCQPLHQATSQI